MSIILEFFSFNGYVLDFGLESGVLGLGLGLAVCVLGLALALGVMSLLTSLVKTRMGEQTFRTCSAVFTQHYCVMDRQTACESIVRAMFIIAR